MKRLIMNISMITDISIKVRNMIIYLFTPN